MLYELVTVETTGYVDYNGVDRDLDWLEQVVRRHVDVSDLLTKSLEFAEWKPVSTTLVMKRTDTRGSMLQNHTMGLGC